MGGRGSRSNPAPTVRDQAGNQRPVVETYRSGDRSYAVYETELGRGAAQVSDEQAEQMNRQLKGETFRAAGARRLRGGAEYLSGAANAALSEAREVQRMVREGANPRAVNTSTLERRLLSDVRAAPVGTRLSVATGVVRGRIENDTATKGTEGWAVSGRGGSATMTDRTFAQYLLGARSVRPSNG